MEHIQLKNIKAKEILPGYKGKFVHSEHMTIVHWDIKANSPMPEHSHVHEQVVNVMQGKFELTVQGKPLVLEPGSVVVIPSNIKHSGNALTDCSIIDVFYPVREEYK